MSTPSNPSPETLRSALARKLLLLLLATGAAAAGLALLTRQIQTASLSLQVILSDVVCGLVAGFSARLVFRQQVRLLQFAAGLAALVGGLALLGRLTGWQIGIGPLEAGRRMVDWSSLGQLCLGMGAALLGLQSWQRRTSSPDPAAPKRRTAASPRSKPREKKLPRRAPAPQPGIVPASAGAALTKPRRRGVLGKRPQVQLSGLEEHRCPFCLELIEADDPRGMVECKVCHTRHHADCWAITGACQVPHYNA